MDVEKQRGYRAEHGKLHLHPVHGGARASRGSDFAPENTFVRAEFVFRSAGIRNYGVYSCGEFGCQRKLRLYGRLLELHSECLGVGPASLQKGKRAHDY